MKKVEQVDLPVPLGIEVERQVHPRQFAREPLAFRIDGRPRVVLVQHLGVIAIDLLGVLAKEVKHALGLLAFERISAALAVGPGLDAEMLGRRDVELVIEDRIARRIFVDVGGAVADPLAGDEDRQLDVVLDLAHLERRRVAVAHEVVDQPPVLAHPLGALAVGDPRRLHDRPVIAHVIDDADEAVVQHRQRLIKDFLEFGHGRAPGLGAGGALRFDLFKLFRGEGHGCFRNGSVLQFRATGRRGQEKTRPPRPDPTLVRSGPARACACRRPFQWRRARIIFRSSGNRLWR